MQVNSPVALRVSNHHCRKPDCRTGTYQVSHPVSRQNAVDAFGVHVEKRGSASRLVEYCRIALRRQKPFLAAKRINESCVVRPSIYHHMDVWPDALLVQILGSTIQRNNRLSYRMPPLHF